MYSLYFWSVFGRLYALLSDALCLSLNLRPTSLSFTNNPHEYIQSLMYGARFIQFPPNYKFFWQKKQSCKFWHNMDQCGQLGNLSYAEALVYIFSLIQLPKFGFYFILTFLMGLYFDLTPFMTHIGSCFNLALFYCLFLTQKAASAVEINFLLCISRSPPWIIRTFGSRC